MCGRYAMTYSSDELPEQFARYNLKVQSPEKQHPKSFNVAPTAISPVYRSQDKVLQYMKWGLIPHWVKDVSKFKTFRTFNAREESLQRTRMWTQTCNNKRCVVPVSGYYEWKTSGRNKTPFYVTRRDGKLMFLAGMYDHVEKDNLWSFTIITGVAPESLKWLHDRMPVSLEPESESWDKWLSDQSKWKQQELDDTLRTTYNPDEMKCYQVNNSVGKTVINEEYLIKPILKRDRDEKEGKKDHIEDRTAEVEKEDQAPVKEEKENNLHDIKKEHQDIKVQEESSERKSKNSENSKRDVTQMLSPRKHKRQRK